MPTLSVSYRRFALERMSDKLPANPDVVIVVVEVAVVVDVVVIVVLTGYKTNEIKLSNSD